MFAGNDLIPVLERGSASVYTNVLMKVTTQRSETGSQTLSARGRSPPSRTGHRQTDGSRLWREDLCPGAELTGLSLGHQTLPGEGTSQPEIVPSWNP